MAKLPGSIWVEGDLLHYVDTNSAEWIAIGTRIGPVTGAVPGSIWCSQDFGLRYITEDGASIYGLGPIPWPANPAPANAVMGSLWVEGNLLHWTTTPYEITNHFDVAASSIHGDVPHTNSGTHTDTPHSNTHTNTHGDVAHSDRAHTDHNDHNDTAHGNTHTNTHGDSPHQDAHGDYGTHYDAIYFLNNEPPGHSDTQYHGDTPDDYHTNVAHTNTHGDVAHKDTPHTNHQDHQDIAHLDSHTNTHGDVPHSDIAHGDTGTHSDIAHTNTHTNTAHNDQPTYVGP